LLIMIGRTKCAPCSSNIKQGKDDQRKKLLRYACSRLNNRTRFFWKDREVLVTHSRCLTLDKRQVLVEVYFERHALIDMRKQEELYASAEAETRAGCLAHVQAC
jgi:hypothetical protein